MDVDVTEWDRMLLRIEAQLHTLGWDTPPHRGAYPALVIYDRGHTSTDTAIRKFFSVSPRAGVRFYNGRLVGQHIVDPDVYTMAPVAPPAAMWTLACNCAYASADSARAVIPVDVVADGAFNAIARVCALFRMPGVAGFAFGGEAYGLFDDSPDAEDGRRELAAGTTRRIADMPGGQEARQVAGVSVNGHSRMAVRVRGRKPTIKEGDVLSGGVLRTLRLLVAVANDRVPPPDQLHTLSPDSNALLREALLDPSTSVSAPAPDGV